MWDILYPCGWKIIPSTTTYVRYFVPWQLENHTFVIHLHEKYSTLAVGKPYLSSYIYDEKYILLSEYEFQSHSPPNHQLIILKVAVPVYWISYTIGTLSYVYDSSIWNEFHQIKEWKSVQDYSQSSGKRQYFSVSQEFWSEPLRTTQNLIRTTQNYSEPLLF